MNKTLKYIRIVLATLMLLCITALLLDTTGVLRHYLDWAPKLQLLPNIMALNVVMVLAVLVMTFLVGRLYCAIVCPLGIMQDLFLWIRKLVFPKHKYHYRKPQNWLRYVLLALFVIAMVTGANSIAVLIAPYSMYGRIITQIHSSGLPQIVAIVSLAIVGILSFSMGRMWCNTICPIGSLLSIISRWRLFGVQIDQEKCVGCHRCEQGCKSMCINIDEKSIDHSRCVDCWNCMSQCKVRAISLGLRKKRNIPTDSSRRKFIASTAAIGVATALQAQEQKLDGGLAAITGKQVPDRRIPLKPFGARSRKNFETRCTSCQLCVSQCPEHVLRPSTKLESLLQPELNYSEGYCRMACTRCSEVCPSGAIMPISKEEKTAISIGIAIPLHQNCLSATGKDQCGACARHCPSSAISMITNAEGHPAPVVNESRCLGCGACEYYCPARPMTAIYIEGKETHSDI